MVMSINNCISCLKFQELFVWIYDFSAFFLEIVFQILYFDCVAHHWYT